MAYIALYRKYRSQSFEELMGQEGVTTTLRNAIAAGKIGHAYLFHGARGCGKTSTARLLARALNCEKGPTPTPCGECRICVSIREGSCLDVLEMDAASETGIDDVREKVIENVQYVPAEARYKVYIIDEVHDLSAKAFDALLKTLEEPPAHVVFVLATTEYHKVPITIRSRCMSFQFRRGSLHDLSRAIERVIAAEGSTAEPAAIQAIARSAEGSWRDALSLLEQALAYSDGCLTEATVQRAIGTVGEKELEETARMLAGSDMGQALLIAGRLMETGVDARQLLASLQGYLRDLLLIAAGAEQTALQELGAERLERMKPAAALFTPQSLLQMGAELAQAEREVRASNFHRWILERTLMRLQTAAHPSAAVPALPVRTQQPELHPPSSAARTEAAAAAPPPIPRPALTHTPEDAAAETAPAAQTESRFAEAITLEVLQRAWPRVLKLFEKASPRGGAFLKEARILALEKSVVRLGFESAFACEQINSKGKEMVERKLNEALQTQGYRIRCEMIEQNALAKPAQTAKSAPPPQDGLLAEKPSGSSAPQAASAQDETFIQEVINVFDGEVVNSDA